MFAALDLDPATDCGRIGACPPPPNGTKPIYPKPNLTPSGTMKNPGVSICHHYPVVFLTMSRKGLSSTSPIFTTTATMLSALGLIADFQSAVIPYMALETPEAALTAIIIAMCLKLR